MVKTQTVLSSLNRKYSTYTKRKKPQYKTGITTLDTLVEGWREAELIQIIGKPYTGKSDICLHAINESIKVNRPVLYIGAANYLNTYTINTYHINSSLVYFAYPTNIERCFGIVGEFSKNVPNSLIIIDSLACLPVHKDIENCSKLRAGEVTSKINNIRHLIKNTKNTLMVVNNLYYNTVKELFVPTFGNTINVFFDTIVLCTDKKDIKKKYKILKRKE